MKQEEDNWGADNPCQEHLDVEAVRKYMAWAEEEGLAVEVVTWAMYAIRSNPEITISEAMYHGYNEWVK